MMNSAKYQGGDTKTMPTSILRFEPCYMSNSKNIHINEEERKQDRRVMENRENRDVTLFSVSEAYTFSTV